MGRLLGARALHVGVPVPAVPGLALPGLALPGRGAATRRRVAGCGVRRQLTL